MIKDELGKPSLVRLCLVVSLAMTAACTLLKRDVSDWQHLTMVFAGVLPFNGGIKALHRGRKP